MTGLFGPAKKKRKGASPSTKEEIMLRQGSKCKKCPTKFSLKVRPHIDHKDGDRSNNKPSNLQALCPNCHDQKSRRETKRRSNPKKPKREYFGLGDLSFGLGPTTTSKRKKKKKPSDDFGLGDLSFGL